MHGQCTHISRRILKYETELFNAMGHIDHSQQSAYTVRYTVLQCVAMCCSVALCCSVLQCGAIVSPTRCPMRTSPAQDRLKILKSHCHSYFYIANIVAS